MLRGSTGGNARGAVFLVVALVLLLFLPWPWNVFASAAGVGLFTLEVMYWYRRMRGQRVQTGVENLVGSVGEVVEPLMPSGQIRVLGELWQARAEVELPRGTPVRVVKVEGLTLEVEAARTRSANGAAPGGAA
jgi:membrane-bound serine protease (ClpP class)